MHLISLGFAAINSLMRTSILSNGYIRDITTVYMLSDKDYINVFIAFC